MAGSRQGPSQAVASFVQVRASVYCAPEMRNGLIHLTAPGKDKPEIFLNWAEFSLAFRYLGILRDRLVGLSLRGVSSSKNERRHPIVACDLLGVLKQALAIVPNIYLPACYHNQNEQYTSPGRHQLAMIGLQPGGGFAGGPNQ